METEAKNTPKLQVFEPSLPNHHKWKQLGKNQIIICYNNSTHTKRCKTFSFNSPRAVELSVPHVKVPAKTRVSVWGRYIATYLTQFTHPQLSTNSSQPPETDIPYHSKKFRKPSFKMP